MKSITKRNRLNVNKILITKRIDIINAYTNAKNHCGPNVDFNFSNFKVPKVIKKFIAKEIIEP